MVGGAPFSCVCMPPLLQDPYHHPRLSHSAFMIIKSLIYNGLTKQERRQGDRTGPAGSAL